MGKIFNATNPFWTFIGKLLDVIVLHILWLVCSLPIITFGASTAALYYALMNDVADEDPHFVKAFFRSFKMNFKQGIGIGLIMIIVGALLLFSLWFYNNIQLDNATILSVLKGLNIMFLVMYLFVSHYIYPVFARFDNKTKTLFLNAFFLSIKNLGWTLLMVVMDILVYVVLLYIVGFFPILIWGYGLVAYVSSYFLNRIFKPYIKEINGDEDEMRNPDEWEVPEDITEEQVHIILGLTPEQIAAREAQKAAEQKALEDKQKEMEEAEPDDKMSQLF